jgi:hypothetical protein
MFVRKKLSIAVAALVVSTQIGSSWGNAAPSAGQIAELQQYLTGKNYAGMANLLTTNPDLLTDDSPLAAILRKFVHDYQTGNFSAFSAEELARLEIGMTEACGNAPAADGTVECSLY